MSTLSFCSEGLPFGCVVPYNRGTMEIASHRPAAERTVRPRARPGGLAALRPRDPRIVQLLIPGSFTLLGQTVLHFQISLEQLLLTWGRTWD